MLSFLPNLCTGFNYSTRPGPTHFADFTLIVWHLPPPLPSQLMPVSCLPQFTTPGPVKSPQVKIFPVLSPLLRSSIKGSCVNDKKSMYTDTQ